MSPLTPSTALAISEALAAADRARKGVGYRQPIGTALVNAEGPGVAAKLHELDAQLCALLREDDRIKVDMGLVAVGVSLRALAVRLEGAP